MESEILFSLITSGMSVLIALFSAISSFLFRRSAKHNAEAAVTNEINERIESAYVECPACGAKTSIDNVSISFPPVIPDSKINIKEVLKNGK